MNLLYEWNAPSAHLHSSVAVLDDTLRDGLQSPSAVCPSLAGKKAILSLGAAIGVQCAILGFPAGSKRSYSDIAKLAVFLAEQHPQVESMTAVRTHPKDLSAHRQLCQDTGIGVTVALFVGCSPIRTLIENWDMNTILRDVEASVSVCIRDGIPVLFVTEDTTRARPQTIADIYGAAIGAGAQRICIADTVGHAEPSGVCAIMCHVREIIARYGIDVGIDWHGHNDKGLALANALAAADHGATRIHATGLGLGERTGNTSIEQLIVNLSLRTKTCDQGVLGSLVAYCEAVHKYCRAPLPVNHPIVGRDAFRTSSGIHAAAIVKAMQHEDSTLVDLVYSSVPAGVLGREQEIEVGPMSGSSNVHHWLERRHPTCNKEDRARLTSKILENAQHSGRVLKDSELQLIVAANSIVGMCHE